ncbi:hypothetical protein EHI8A_017840 [Entamoeba histolytica HM-1:IMSS-B]|uniref:Uncharacterized protein n=6 Tax=Entamoeba histolytica TaxID=5759 RepID=C4LWY2_ENTH1|nr:hypothetical protein EHI_127070 [Entamoeba histolytica HM-1:IMSS]EMD45417.1 Hypothetical protein EHI5A_031490 [Entamoeba histolytica KU27]EMH73067.1 hypothetical protein EHI8A_017840 [Entamoeba histolytica HM-1:IMSS-B]EMS11608.1 hypothetical protein KM1_040080 [Entamoeba histolytica HM-3:IMSS]ENY60057.1 hypothetical protein EHI7A_049090 [Entamoeba histolytica HM-1:IMSS-A]GAT93228.1 hypothetical protein CL6EHI_127070 [Entamoeba histolytica]|eukprot:XP_651557.1 hypothetical protein EHI_127070 [Entamoeba histolytica HM-1:IMSS]
MSSNKLIQKREFVPLKEYTGRVIYKSFKKNYHKQDGSKGSIVTFVLQDNSGDEVKLVIFDKQVDDCYDKIKENETWTFNNLQIRELNPYQDKESSEMMKSEIKFYREATYNRSKEEIPLIILYINKIFPFSFCENLLNDANFVCFCLEIETEQISSSYRGKFQEIEMKVADVSRRSIIVRCFTCKWNQWIKENIKVNTVFLLGRCHINHQPEGRYCIIREGSYLKVINSYNDIPQHLACQDTEYDDLPPNMSHGFSQDDYNLLIEMRKNVAHINFISVSPPHCRKTHSQTAAIFSLNDYINDVLINNSKIDRTYCVLAYLQRIQILNCFYNGCATCKKKIEQDNCQCPKCKDTTRKVCYKTNALLYETQEDAESNRNSHWAYISESCAEKFIGKTAQEFQDMDEQQRSAIVTPLFSKKYQLVVKGKISDNPKYAGKVWTTIFELTPVEEQ